jgi:protein phosphatase
MRSPAFQAKAFHAFSKPGRRNYNEDAFFPATEVEAADSRVFMVCDGVGGLDGGEHASRIVTEVFGQALQQASEVTAADIDGLVDEVLSQLADFQAGGGLDSAIASTLAMIHLGDEAVTWVHIGDSRIYQFRNTALLHRTSDHSFVQEMVNRGMLTAEEALVHPKRNVITQALSSDAKKVEPTVERLEDVQPGDVFLLCSDGVMEAIDDEGLAALAGRAAEELPAVALEVQERCEVGSSDNNTAVWVVIGERENVGEDQQPDESRAQGGGWFGIWQRLTKSLDQ